MKILVAPDKFKGSLTAAAAAEAISTGLRRGWPGVEIVQAPIADGGEGFAEALRGALGGEWIETTARDPLGREVPARFAWVEETKTAVIEMSEASGYWRVAAHERAPLRANTFGTGQLIRAATERGARQILLGLGGSATTDGGVGMAAALGYEFLTSDGEEIEPLPQNFIAFTRIKNDDAIELPEIVAACDVQNPLLGPRGTAHVFAAQKGANSADIVALEGALLSLADLVATDLGCDFRNTPGAGAAGGIAFGLMSFCGAKICSGFDLIAEMTRLESRIAECDLVITGEGQIDAQTAEGKGPAGVAALARKHGKPVLGFAGSIEEGSAADGMFDGFAAIVDAPVTLDAALRDGAEFLTRSAARTARLLQVGQRL